MKSKWRNITVEGRKYRYATFNQEKHPIGVIAKHKDGDLFLSPLNLARAVEHAQLPKGKLQYGCKPGVCSPVLVAEAIKLKLNDAVPVVKQKKTNESKRRKS